MDDARRDRPKLTGRARLHWDRHDQRMMLLSPERGIILNDSARAILERCDGSRTADTIVDELVALTAGPRDVIARDVGVLLDDLRGRGLLE
jgi:pyrroloquinoline quinone biosynthesis protein D